MNEVGGRLRELGIGVREDWLLQCCNFLQRQSLRPLAQDELDKHVYTQFLSADLNHTGSGVLPSHCSSQQKGCLKGQFVLQVDSFSNVAEPQKKSEHKGTQRIAKLSVTDGVQRLQALEYLPCPLLPDPTEHKAFKLAVRDVQIRRGVLLLVPDSFRVLGGEVNLEGEDKKHSSHPDPPPLESYPSSSRSSLATTSSPISSSSLSVSTTATPSPRNAVFPPTTSYYSSSSFSSFASSFSSSSGPSSSSVLPSCCSSSFSSPFTRVVSESTISPTHRTRDVSPPSSPTSPLLPTHPQKKPSRLKAAKTEHYSSSSISPPSSVSSCCAPSCSSNYNSWPSSSFSSSSVNLSCPSSFSSSAPSDMYFTPPSRCSHFSSSTYPHPTNTSPSYSSSSTSPSLYTTPSPPSHHNYSTPSPSTQLNSGPPQAINSRTSPPSESPVRVAAKKQSSLLDFMWSGKVKDEQSPLSKLHSKQLLSHQSLPPPLEPDSQLPNDNTLYHNSSNNQNNNLNDTNISDVFSPTNTRPKLSADSTFSTKNTPEIFFHPPPRNFATHANASASTPTTPPTPTTATTTSFFDMAEDPALDLDFPLPSEVCRLEHEPLSSPSLLPPTTLAAFTPSTVSDLANPASLSATWTDVLPLEKETKLDSTLGAPKKKITVLGSSKGFSIRRPETGGQEAWQYLDQLDSQPLRVKAVVSNTLGFSFEGLEYELTVMLDDGTAARAARLGNDLVASMLGCSCADLNSMSEADRNSRLEKLEESLPLLEGIMTLAPGDPYPSVTKLEPATRLHGLALLRRLKRMMP